MAWQALVSCHRRMPKCRNRAIVVTVPSSDSLYARALTEIARLRNAQPDLEPVLAYCEALLGEQQKTKAAFHPDLGGQDIKECGQRAAEGLPLLGPDDIELDWALFDGLLGRVVQLGGQYGATPGGAENHSWSSGGSAHWRDKLLPGFLRDRALLEQAAEATGADFDAFAFATCQALIPFMETCADVVRQYVDNSSWLKSYCPVCGAEPLMGMLEKEAGKRYLQCHLCRTDWLFKRVGCPFCGNDDQEKLRFFYDEQDEVNRVEVCDRCKGYLKTVDARKTDRDVVLTVENLATIHLDLLAQHEGFHRGNCPRPSDEGQGGTRVSSGGG